MAAKSAGKKVGAAKAAKARASKNAAAKADASKRSAATAAKARAPKGSTSQAPPKMRGAKGVAPRGDARAKGATKSSARAPDAAKKSGPPKIRKALPLPVEIKRKTIEVAPPPPRPVKKERPPPMARPDVKLAPPPPHRALAEAHVAVATEAIYHLQETEPFGNPPTNDQIVAFAQRLFLTADEIAAFLAAPNVPASAFAEPARVDLLAVARAFSPAVTEELTKLGSTLKSHSFPPSKVASCASHVGAAAGLASKLRASAAYIEYAARRDAEALDKTARELRRDVASAEGELAEKVAPLRKYHETRGQG